MLRPEPITAYVGVNGSGKTLTAIAFALRDLERNDRTLITNVGGLSAPHVSFNAVDELPDLLAETGTCNIVMDEAGAMFPSSDRGQAGKAFRATCQQLRKYKARLLWTAPTFARAEKICREVTFMAILCQPVIKKAVAGDPWPSTRLILQKGFDVSRLDNSGQTMNRNAKSRGFGIVRTSKWENAFDTFHVARAVKPGVAA